MTRAQRVAGTALVIAAAAAALWLTARIGEPMPRTPKGRPDLTGLWAGPAGVMAEPYGPFWNADATAHDEERTARTSASFAEPGWRAFFGRTVLRRSPATDKRLMRPSGAVQLRRRDERRRARGEADSWLDRNTWERCITRSLPPAALPEAHADRWLVLQTPSLVTIVTEALHEHRIAPIGQQQQTPPRSWLGTSKAHWNGDTLVIETSGFREDLDGGEIAPASPIPGQHRGSGAHLQVIEKLRPAGKDRIEVEVEANDPTVYVRPLVYAFTLRREAADSTMYEYACHEGNRAMLGMLAGGRADEERSLAASRAGVDARAAAGHPGVAAPALPFWQPAGP